MWSYWDLPFNYRFFISYHSYHFQRGDRVLSRVEKSVDSLVLYLATLRLGAVYVPLNPAYTLTETVNLVKVGFSVVRY